MKPLRYPAALEGASLIGDLLGDDAPSLQGDGGGRRERAALTRLDITVDVRITRSIRTAP